MLVLSRKKGESIIIGDHIEVTIVAVEGDMVRLGIRAPREVEVHRQEIYAAIQESNKEAAAPAIQNNALGEWMRMFKGNDSEK